MLYRSFCARVISQLFERNQVADFLRILVLGELNMLVRCMLMDPRKGARFARLLPFDTVYTLNEMSLVKISRGVNVYKDFRYDNGAMILRMNVPNLHFYKQCRKWIALDYAALNIINPVCIVHEYSGKRTYDVAYKRGCMLSKLIPNIHMRARESFAMAFFQQALMAMFQNRQAFRIKAERFRFLKPETIYVELEGVIRFVVPNLMAPEVVCLNWKNIRESPYVAPELRHTPNSFLYMSDLDDAREYLSDMWSIGVICLEIIFGERLSQKLVDRLTVNDFNILFTNRSMRGFISQCLSHNPNGRPNFYRTLAATYVEAYSPWTMSVCDELTTKMFNLTMNGNKSQLMRTFLLADLIRRDALRLHGTSLSYQMSQSLIRNHICRLNGSIIMVRRIVSKTYIPRSMRM